MEVLSIKTIVVYLCIFSFLVGQSIETIQNIIVDKSGSRNFTTIQEAVNYMKVGNTKRVIIKIRAGIYQEKINVPYNKLFITFQGVDMYKSIITWNKSATTTIIINADHFIERMTGFRNTAPRRHKKRKAIAL